MSRAFVNEDAAAPAEPQSLPTRPISGARNLVTARGLARIDETLAHHRDALAAAHASGDAEAATREERELRYWAARRATAELGEPRADAETVGFGALVTVRDESGSLRRYRIVGEDEGEPEAGLIAWTTPVARALLGSSVGDIRTLPRGEIEVVAIDP